MTTPVTILGAGAVARSRPMTASSAGAARTGRQALSGIRPISCPDSTAPAELPAL
jgi:hypothetical protein